MLNYFFLFFVLLLILINFFLKKNKILNHKIDNYEHKKIGEKNIPLSGGLYFIFPVLFFLYFYEFDFGYLIFFILFLILGLVIDTGHEINPKLRLLFHLIIISSFVFFNDFMIFKTGILVFDQALKIEFLSFIFTIFCLVVFLNGLNFIDGVNCNSIGYSLMVASTILFIHLNILNLSFVSTLFIVIVSSIIVFYIFNLFNKNFLGESGNYILGFFLGIIIIHVININDEINPLLAVSLLWYPSFENLFSIIRKGYFQKKSAFKPDSSHLHTLIYKFLKKKKYKRANSYAGVVINLFLVPNFLVSYFFYYHTKILSMNVLIYLIIYITSYIILNKKL